MKRTGRLVLLLLTFLVLTGCGQKAKETKEAKEAEETWQDQYDLGMKYLEEEKYEEAIAAFTASIEKEAKQPDSYLARGGAYILSGENPENLSAALADYEQAVELDEACVQAYLGLADVYIRQREYEKALEILREGFGKTGEEKGIKDKIEEMESGNILDSEGKNRRIAYYVDGNLFGYIELYYSEEGKTSGVAALDAAGNQTEYKEFVYDEHGNRVEYWYGADIDGAVKLSKETYEYDAEGNCIKTIHYGEDENPDVYYLNEFGENGKLAKRSTYGIEGDFRGYHLYEYDENGNRIKYSLYDSDEMLTQYILSEYNENGNLIKESTYDKKGEMTQYITYEYDENGKRVSRNRVKM